MDIVSDHVHYRANNKYTLTKMATDTTYIVVGDFGPNYTPKGERRDLIQQKAFAFKETWASFKTTKDPTTLTKPALVTEDAWIGLIKNLYEPTETNVKRVKFLCDLERVGFDLLLGDEKEMRSSLTQILSSERNVREPSYANAIASLIRQGLFAIGREYRWGDNEDIEILGHPLVKAGNPMSKSNQGDMREHVAEKKKQIVKKQTEDGTLPVGPKNKKGAPTSLALIHFLILMFLEETLQDFGRINQLERLVNRAFLGLLLGFSMHEGSRPGEIHKHAKHSHLYFVLHKRVYWLTLVFLQPTTLKYILENNLLTSFVAMMWKGKKMQKFLERIKSVIPHHYNSMDLPTLFTVFMRLILTIDPSQLSHIVFKQTNYSKHLHDQTTVRGFKDLTFYGIRYTGGEEDKAANIDPSWTRQRKGHTKKSNQKDKYASNRMERVRHLGEKVPLGVDLIPKATNSNQISLEFNTVKGSHTFDSSFLNKLPSKYCKDFEEVDDLVSKYVEEDDMNAKNILLERLASQGSFDDWCALIPFGMNMVFPAKSFPVQVKKVYAEVKESLTKYFAPSTFDPSTMCTPEVWSLTQTCYGNWHPLNANPSSNTQVCDPPPSDYPLDSLLDSPLDSPLDVADSLIAITLPQPTPKTKKRKAPMSPNPPSILKQCTIDWDWIPTNIEKNNFVVLLCSSKDKYSFEVPGYQNVYVWVAKAISFNRRTSDFRGKFFSNSTRDLLAPMTLQQRAQIVTLDDTDVLGIYDDKTLELTPQDITLIKEYLSKHPDQKNMTKI